MGILRAVLDAIMGGANRAGGRAVTKLSAPLTAAETSTMEVESTLRFGEWVDDASDARLLVGGEIIEATGRTSSTFTGLTRGPDPKGYPAGTLVLDMSQNVSAVDLVRRGIFVDTAIGEDLDTIGRNLGLRKCPSIDQETWRRIIKAVAYLPKTTIDAFDKALEALTNDSTAYEITERLLTHPYEIFVAIEVALVSNDPDGIVGRFVLTGGHPQVTDGLTQVSVSMFGSAVKLQSVRGVYLDTLGARRGLRDGLTNYFSGGGSFVAGTDVITLGSSPGPIGTEVLVDFTAYGSATPINYHYLGTGFGADQVNLDLRYSAGDVTTIQTIQHDDGDRWAYLSDPLLAARCLLNEIRQAGTHVTVSTKL